MRDVSKALVGAILVFAAYYLGLFAVNIMALPIPGALVGLLILLGILFIFPKLETHTHAQKPHTPRFSNLARLGL